MGRQVVRVDSNRCQSTVYEDVRRSFMALVEKEILSLTKDLLAALDIGNSNAYTCLISPLHTSIIQGNSNLFIDDDCSSSINPDAVRQSTLVRPHVRVMGKSAVVSYVRVIQARSEACQDGSIAVASSEVRSFSCEESRVWQLSESGTWLVVHTHQVFL